MNSKEVYRKCASVMVFRPSKNDASNTEILLLHKPRKKDAWQLPQGGIEDGESVEQAALRELKEEAGVDAHLLGTSKETYSYDFPSSYRRFRPDHVKGQVIHFVFAELSEGQVVQVDQDEIDAHVWVQIDQIEEFMERKKYNKLVEALYAEGIDLRS